MQVFSSIDEAAASGSLRGCAVALGNFDGVHLGHQALFAAAARLGRAVALTFQPHPGKVLQPTLAPKLIATPARKLELLEQQNLFAAVTQPFTLEYAKVSPAEFEAQLFDLLQVGAVVVGHDFTYGSKRGGTVETLKKAAQQRGAVVEIVPPVAVDGVVVSSSRIREYLLEGRVEAAARLLGRPFELAGMVVAGAGRGRTIGVPTANIDTDNELRPAVGVYAVRTFDDGVWRSGAANIGAKPTFGGSVVTIEVHLLDYSGNLYGRRLRVRFIERLREERRFASVGELTAQIGRDIEAARSVLLKP